jgi:hypothetical protein
MSKTLEELQAEVERLRAIELEARRAAAEAENKWRDALRKWYEQQGGDDANTAPKDSSS